MPTGDSTPNLPDDKQVGLRVRTLRIRVGISQREFAQALGVSYQCLSKCERGSSRISAARLALMAQVLGVDPTELIGERNPEHALADEQLYRAMKLFRGLSAGQRASILQLMRALQPDDGQ